MMPACRVFTLCACARQEIRIAHMYSKTGPLEVYGKQTLTGVPSRRWLGGCRSWVRATKPGATQAPACH